MSAARKAAKAKSARTGAHAKVVAIAKEINQFEAESAIKEAKKKAESEARRDRSEHPAKYLADDDVIEATRRMGDVLISLLAIHRVADAIPDSGDAEACALYALAIKEMARANVKGLDACIERLLGRGRSFGCFAGEFDD